VILVGLRGYLELHGKIIENCEDKEARDEGLLNDRSGKMIMRRRREEVRLDTGSRSSCGAILLPLPLSCTHSPNAQ